MRSCVFKDLDNHVPLHCTQSEGVTELKTYSVAFQFNVSQINMPTVTIHLLIAGTKIDSNLQRTEDNDERASCRAMGIKVTQLPGLRRIKIDTQRA